MPGNESATSLLPKIAGYTEILAKDPKSTVFVPLADAYRQMGLLDDALEVARKGVAILPKFGPGLAILGRIHAQKGDVPSALESFEKALVIDEENLSALKGLISLRMQRGEKDLARPLLERVVALRPEDQKARDLLDKIPMPSLKSLPGTPTPAAKRHSETPEEGQEDAPISTTTIAEIYVRQGFLKRAMKVYRDILQADPHNEDVRRKLVLLKNRIEAEEAQGNLEQTEMVSPPPSTPAASSPLRSIVDAEIEALSRHLEAISRRRQHVR